MYSAQVPNRWKVMVRRNLWLGIGLLAVGLLMWGRLRMREIPRTAMADDPRKVAAAPSHTDGTEPTDLAGAAPRRLDSHATVTEAHPPKPAPSPSPVPDGDNGSEPGTRR